MPTRTLLTRGGLIVRMITRLTPLSPAVGIADDAKKLAQPDTERLAAQASRALQSVADSYRDVSPDDRRAVEAQLRDMLKKVDFDLLLSYALSSAGTLEAWLVQTRTVATPRFLGVAEHYFADLLTAFCGFAHFAAVGSQTSDTHVRLLVARQDSRLQDLDLGLTTLRVEIADLDRRLVNLERSPEEKIDESARELLRVSQEEALEGARPDVLPEADRLQELTSAVGAVSYPVLLLGEGGIGKSVLARQLVRSALTKDEPALLVPCGRVPAGDRLASPGDVDLAFGRAASPACSFSITDWIADSTKGDVRPLVVIDTLDLLLREDTADYLEETLLKLASTCRLAVTCRETEWRDLVVRPSVSAWPAWSIPLLPNAAVMAWASAYTASAGIADKKDAQFLESMQRALDKHRGRDVFGSPLRLAMACQLYAKTGALPEHLTVSDLYRDYWKRRIDRDRRGRITDASGRHEVAARETSRAVWRASVDRLIEFVTPPPALSGEARRYLASEGILHQIGDRFGFFHQTFAEYGIARVLAAEATSDDLVRLRAGLSVSRSGYWGIAGHLVHQPIDADRFRALIAAFPPDRAEGLRLMIGWALSMGDAEVLDSALAEAADAHPDLLAASWDTLDRTPTAFAPLVVRRLADAIGHATTGLTTLVRTWSGLLQLLAPADRSAEFTMMAGILANRVQDIGPTVYPEHQRLVSYTVAVDPAAYTLDAILQAYEVLSPAGRTALLTALASLARSPAETEAVLAAILAFPYPADDFTVGAELLIQAFAQDGARRALGWRDWRDLLIAPYEPRWDGCQVRSVASLADAPDVWRELLEALFGNDRANTDRLLNAALFVADAHPSRVALALLTTAAPTDRRGAAAFAKLARKAADDPTEATPATDAWEPRLVARLVGLADLDPKNVWPAAMRVACRSPQLLDEALAELASQAAQGRVPSPAISGALDILYAHSTPKAVVAHEAQVVGLVESCLPTARAQLDGWLASASERARERVVVLLADRSRPDPANAAARMTVAWVSQEPTPEALTFVLRLLDTPHWHSLRLLLTALVPCLKSLPAPEGLADKLLHRLVEALRQHQDPQVIQWLVNALRSTLRSLPPSEPTRQGILALCGIFREEVSRGIANEETGWTPGVFTQWASSLGTIAAPYATVDETTDAVVDLLTFADLAKVANRSQRRVAQLLVRVYSARPLAWPRVESLWTTIDDVSRAAIIEALLAMPWPAAAERAARLARDPLCPPLAASKALRTAPAAVA